jgi:hypothetical protein
MTLPEIIRHLVLQFTDLDLSFYTEQLDAVSLDSPSMTRHLAPLLNLHKPYSRLYLFPFADAKILFYSIPRRASTGILEGFLRHYNPTLISAIKQLDISHEEYCSYIHQASKKYLSKDPVRDYSSATYAFYVYRPSHEHLASAIGSKILAPRLKQFPYESYVIKYFSDLHIPIERIPQVIGDLTVSELVKHSLHIPDDHFGMLKYRPKISMSEINLSSLSVLENNIYRLTGHKLMLQPINITSQLSSQERDMTLNINDLTTVNELLKMPPKKIIIALAGYISEKL